MWAKLWTGKMQRVVGTVQSYHGNNILTNIRCPNRVLVLSSEPALNGKINFIPHFIRIKAPVWPFHWYINAIWFVRQYTWPYKGLWLVKSHHVTWSLASDWSASDDTFAWCQCEPVLLRAAARAGSEPGGAGEQGQQPRQGDSPGEDQIHREYPPIIVRLLDGSWLMRSE